MVVLNKIEYAKLIHSRLNHVQVLLSALCGILLTLMATVLIAIATVSHDPSRTLPNNAQYDKIVVWIIYGALYWAHLFTLYQLFVVVKSAKILTILEKEIDDYKGLHYFQGNGLRYILYAFSHGLPSLMVIVYPFALPQYFLWRIDYLGIYIFVFVTLAVCILLYIAFFKIGDSREKRD